jgi:TonB family protein
MKRSDFSILIALSCSIAAHAAGLFAIRRFTVGSQGFATRVSGDAPRWVRPEKPESSPRSPDAPKPLPEPKLSEAVEDQELFGERGSKGKGLNSTPGDLPLQSRQAPEQQAALTTNPGMLDQGSHGDGKNPGDNASPLLTSAAHQETSIPMVQLPFGPPVDLNEPFGSPPLPTAPPLPPPMFQKELSTVIGVAGPRADPFLVKSAVTKDDSAATRPSQLASSNDGTDTKALASEKPTTQPSHADEHPQTAMTERPPEDAIGRRPTSTQPSLIKLMASRPQAPADLLALSQSPKAAIQQNAGQAGSAPGSTGGGEPGNKSESESDPFTDSPAIIYRNGKVEARDGRKVKTVRPKLTEAGWVALSAMEDPSVSLAVSIDETGKVTNVEYVHSSGSNEVDHPAYLAMWKWEFEPSKDKAGHPKPDLFIIPLIWR